MKTIRSEIFGISKLGETVYRYILENDHGMRVQIINYACAIQSILVPDKKGRLTDVVLGYDSLAKYEAGSCFFGAFVGRYANRIKRAQFELNGKTYFLPQNDGKNHLHGTYTKRVFPAEIVGDRLIFHGVSPDGEEGFPGTLTFDVIYRLTNDNELLIILGLLTLLRPGNIMNFICISFGVCMIADSLFKAKIAFDAKQFGVHEWWLTLALSILTGLAGLVLAFRPSEAVSVIMTLLGVSLLTEGILNLSVAISLVKIVNNQMPDVIDVEYYETEEDS